MKVTSNLECSGFIRSNASRHVNGNHCYRRKAGALYCTQSAPKTLDALFRARKSGNNRIVNRMMGA